ncbi:MAG: replication initiation protein, partial [Emticicia sp.]|uniref:replication initiation protein n=1 Tax=Emticicia sp. TaxID=1930953 RepID=UPI003BA5C043
RQGKYIELDFHPDMKPYLLQLQSKFLMYDVRNVLKLPSSFSIRIYELLKQYETIGKRKMSVEEIKEMLDIKEKYSLYANLKQRVIMKAQTDLEEFTDIKFTFEEVKRGKSVEFLIFYIFKNKNVIDRREGREEVVIEYQLTEKDVAATQIYNLLRNFKGSSKSTVEDWLKKYSIEHVMNRLTFVKNQLDAGKEIKNPMGLLQKMMLEPNLFDPIQEEKEKQQEVLQKVRQEQELKNQRLNKEQQTERLKIIYEERKLSFISSCFEQLPNLSKEFLTDFKNRRNEEDAPFIVQLAYDNYTTNIAGIEPESSVEILYNYKLGGSFSALLIEWFEAKFVNEMSQIKKDFDLSYRSLIND